MSAIRTFLVSLALVLFISLPARTQGITEPAVALQGMDVVSYFKDGGPVKGQTAHSHDFDGARYLFSNTQNKTDFVAEPDRYLPQFSGLCTTGLSKGFIGQSDPNVWKIVGGKLYLFSTAERMPADAHVAATIAGANQIWAKRN